MSDNLRIWNAVSKTNPAHTKKVNQRGGFTAISAAYQIMAATEQFGPIGIGWGYTTGEPVIIDTLITIPVTLWHGSRDNTFGPMWGCEEWKVKDRVDSDAPKKATTDGLTKLLSQLGFNADVFLGLYDDNKYVAKVTREFAEKAQPKILVGEMLESEQEALRKLNEVDDPKRLDVWFEDNKPIIDSADEASKAVLRAAYTAKKKGLDAVQLLNAA